MAIIALFSIINQMITAIPSEAGQREVCRLIESLTETLHEALLAIDAYRFDEFENIITTTGTPLAMLAAGNAFIAIDGDTEYALRKWRVEAKNLVSVFDAISKRVAFSGETEVMIEEIGINIGELDAMYKTRLPNGLLSARPRARVIAAEPNVMRISNIVDRLIGAGASLDEIADMAGMGDRLKFL